MVLAREDAQAISEILVSMYGHWIGGHPAPTEKTVEILEEMLAQMRDCNKQVRMILATLPCSIARGRRGWLLRCARKLAGALRMRSYVWAGCKYTIVAKRKQDILGSLAH